MLRAKASGALPVSSSLNACSTSERPNIGDE
jgi:hypothetical protein